MVTIAVWWRHPGFRLLLPYASGIVAGSGLTVDIAFFAPTSGVLFLVVCSLPIVFKSIRLRPLIGIMAMLLLFVLGVSLASIGRKPYNKTPEAGQYICVLKDAPLRTAKSYKTMVDVYSGIDGVKLGTALLYLDDDIDASGIRAGDWLSFTGDWQEFERPKNPGQFNSAAYYSTLSVDWRAFSDSTDFRVIHTKPSFSLRSKMAAWRQKAIMQWEKHGLDGEAGIVAGALVLGDKSELPKEVLNAFANAGVIHVLCVSGMHAGIVFMMVSYLIGSIGIGRRSAALKIILPSIAVWAYAMLTGFSPSVLRASVLITITMASFALGRRSERAGMLAMAAFLILLVEPDMLYKTGFQLSFLAVLGIVMVSSLGRLPVAKPWLVWLLGTILVSLAAQALTTPLSMHLFHRFPTYFLISNILIVPLATAALWLCAAALAMSFIGPVASILAWLASKSIEGMLYVVNLINSLPGANIDRIQMPVITVILAYLLIGSVWFWLSFRNAGLIKFSLIILLTISILAMYHNIRSVQAKTLCIYSTGAYPAIDIFLGREVYSIHAIPDDKYPFLLSSVLEPCRGINKVKNEYCMGSPLISGQQMMWQVEGVQIAVVVYPDEWTQRLVIEADADIVIIGGKRVPDTVEVRSNPPQILICDSYKQPVLVCDEESQQHNLSNGAFIVDLQLKTH